MTTVEVTFRRPFHIDGFEMPQAAGTYTVETEEEQIPALSFPAWKRIATVMHVHRAGATEYVRIDPRELEDALSRDVSDTPDALPKRLMKRKKF
jgi:hypothetical protein